MTWYILKDGTKEGPYSHERLQELIEKGYVKPHDLVWKQGLPKWAFAADVPGLSMPPPNRTGASRPSPPEAVEPRQEGLRLQPSGQEESSHDVGSPGGAEAQARAQSPSYRPGFPLRTEEVDHKVDGGSFVLRHWRGEFSLPYAYWINGALLSFVFAILIRVIPWAGFMTGAPKLSSAGVVALWLLIALATVWQLVGIWLSAGNYLRDGGSKLWGNLARIAMVFGLISAIGTFATVGVPQMAEYAKIAIGRDPIGEFEVRVLRDATELEVSGFISFGLTKEVRRALNAQPAIRLIHLNSPGGRVVEARNLRDLIASKRLSTYTSAGCLSACTLAFAAGEKRLVARNAELGFHQYSFPGTKGRELRSEYEQDKRDWLARGFTQAFVDRAYATPSNQMWKPSHQELFAAGIATGYPESDDVAVTGFKPEDPKSIEAELLKSPLFAALKACEPPTYDRLVSEIRTGLQQGRSAAELREKVFPVARSVFSRSLPLTSDAALRSFGHLMLEQIKVLESADTSVCYDFVYNEYGGVGFNPTKYFSPELIERESSVMADVIRSATGGAAQPTNQKQVEGDLHRVLVSLAARYGDDAKMLVDRERGKANKTRTCELISAFYREVLSLPEQDSARLLRHLFAGKKS